MSREKQIEEMRKDIFAAFGGYAKWEEDWQSLAEAIYTAGYRKQSDGEWKKRTVGNGWDCWYELTCSLCGVSFEDKCGKMPKHFCPNCGAKMKGGAE